MTTRPSKSQSHIFLHILYIFPHISSYFPHISTYKIMVLFNEVSSKTESPKEADLQTLTCSSNLIHINLSIGLPYINTREFAPLKPPSTTSRFSMDFVFITSEEVPETHDYNEWLRNSRTEELRRNNLELS